MRAAGLLAAALLATGNGALQSPSATTAAEALHAGDYEAALAALGREARADPRKASVHRALARTLADLGRTAEALAAVQAFQSANPRSPELLETQGELELVRGRTTEAESALKKSIAAGAGDALLAEVVLAGLRRDRGEREASEAGYRRLIQAYNAGQATTSEQLMAVAMACHALGDEDPQLLKDALKAFDEAIEADPDNLDARVRLAEMFLEKYNNKDASETVQEALERNPAHPRALLARARVLDFDGAPGVMEALSRSLQTNPSLAEARVFRAEVLIDQEDYAAAATEAEGVLAANPASLPALTALAAARYLQGDTARFHEAERRALALDARDAELYNRLAELSARNRLYREAVGFAQQALALDPRTWRGLGILGLNQLRTGAIEDGQRHLEASFEGDPYNVWIKNTLDLLDTFPKYRETRTAHFRILLHAKEADLLAPYAAALAEEAYAKLSVRYGYEPQGPVRVEVYPDHADFSVRTVGLAGLAGLGACFGPVAAIDSPSAREVGQFNWGSTLWHELAHTFTLGLSGNRVPRWFTEGLSVHEEHRARPGWGDDVTVEFLRALEAGELLPIRDLNRGFVRPKGPEQVAISYYQASLVVEWIEAQKGIAAIVDLLKAYRDGLPTEQAFTKVLGMSPDAVDAAVLATMRERWSGPLQAMGDPPAPGAGMATRLAAARDTPEAAETRARAEPGRFDAQVAAGTALFGAGKRAEALPYFERARTLFPDLGGAQSPHWFLAVLYKDAGRKAEALAELQRLTAITDSHYQAQLELSRLLEDAGDLAGATAALEAALYISPFEPAVHERLAALHARLGDPAGVVRARRALLALDPVDRPEALLKLAQALLDAGDAAGARREVLHALELAPRFQRAQELLLRLHDARPAGGTQ